jgi:hypothetical protein
MVSVPDYPRGSSVVDDPERERPPKQRFRLFATLAAPFRDVDDRALHKKHEQVELRNNSKGNLFAPRAAARAEIPVRRFQRGDHQP